VISLKDILRCWNRFFFEPESPLPIAVYRILFGLVVLTNYAFLLPDVHEWFSDRGTLSFKVAGRLVGGTGFSLFNWLPHTDAWVWTIFIVSCLAAVTLTIGFLTRASSIVLFLTLMSLQHRNPVILNSGDTVLRLAAFYLIFSQAGAALSLDRLIRIARGKESGAPVPRAPWATRLIQLQVSLIYLYAFVWKAMGAMWLSGTAVYYTSRLSEFWRFPVPYVFEHVWTIKLWSWATLFVELALGTLIWIKELRYWVLLAGVLLHLGIEYSMNIQLFAFIMISTFVTFVETHRLEAAFAWLRTRWNSATRFASPVPVLYDGNCTFCLRAVEVAARLDVLRRVAFHDLHDPETRERFPDFDAERGEKEMLVRTDEEWLGGFFAFRYLAKHLPLLWSIYPLLFLKPIISAGDRIYKSVAARRYCILKPEQYASERAS
jgi:predicted DCC family thiol-disulfide oxidoreductase YuxK